MSYIFNNKKLTYNDKWLGRPYTMWRVANYGTIVTGNPKVYAGQTSPFTVVPAEGYDYCRADKFSGGTLLILYKFPYPTSSLEVTTDLYYGIDTTTWYTLQCVGDVNFDIDTNNPTTPNTFRLKYKPNTSPTVNLNGGPNTYTVTLVDAVDNIYDITNTRYDWNSTLKDDTNLLEIVGFMPYGTNQWGQTNQYLTRGLYNTFEGCTSLTSLPARIDLSGIQECTYTFKGCTSLVNLPVYASYMPLPPYNNVDLTGMFYGCTSLVHLPINNACKHELGKGNTSYMFYGCTSLVDTLPYGCYNDASYMYCNCKNIESAIVNIIADTNCESMFNGCTKLKTVDLTINKWSKVRSKRMFIGCTSLTSITLDTPNDSFDTVFRLNEDTGYMFADCAKLSSIPTLDTSTVEDTRYMYRGCTSITTVPLLNLSNATYITGMFLNCYYVQSGALALYQQTSTQANPPRSYGETFKNCGIYTTTGRIELAQIPDGWK